MPGPDSASSCYLVEHEGFRLVLDLGSGSLGALQNFVSLDDIDAILISHQHADHCIDLVPFLVAKKWNPATSCDRTLVIGPAALGPRLVAAYDWPAGGDGASDAWSDSIAIDDLLHLQQPSDGTLGPFTLTWGVASHPGESWSMRLTAAGRSLVYSGDTGPTAALVDLARGADVALFEAGWPAGSDPGRGLHLTPAEAGEHARAAEVDRLIVTHVPPWASRDKAVAEAQEAFGRRVELAMPGAVFEI